MSVVVKGMKMPKNCWKCIQSGFRTAIGCAEWAKISAGRRETERALSCPISAFPDHHGRLIDENEVMVSEKECGEASSCQECRMHVSGCSDMEEIIRNATTIVEAEDGS